GLYQKFLAAKYSCATQVYLFSASPVISVGQSAPLRALVSGFGNNTPQPRGTVTFREGATVLGVADVDATGYAALDVAGLSNGNHNIAADFSGNASVPAATSGIFVQTVTIYTTTTTIALPSPPYVYGTPLSFNVNILSNSNNQSLYESYNLSVDGVTTKHFTGSNPVTLSLGAGTHTLNAAFSGDTLYPPSSSGPVQVTVAKATPSIALTGGALTVRLGVAHTLQFTIQGPIGYAGPTGTLQMTENGNVITTGNLSSGTATLTATLQRGSHDVVIAYSGDGNFNATSIPLTLTVLPNVPLSIEARGLQNAISIRAVLPANTTSTALYRSPSGAGSWLLVNGWTPDFNLDTSVTTRGVLYDYRLTVIASGVTQTSNIDSALLFTDDPVVTGTTPVRRVHFDELRLSINALRSIAGLPPFNFDPSYSGTLIRASHIASMRTALTEARQALGMSLPGFTDTITTGTPVRGVHIQELRDQSR
ncbi:MAG TPA: Ig-like domain-containing protein, partial [Vicinamibacterales bacterium]